MQVLFIWIKFISHEKIFYRYCYYNEKHVSDIEALLENYSANLEVVGTATTLALVLKLIKKLKPDLAFLGIEWLHDTVFEKLHPSDLETTKVIFLTSHEHFSIQALRFGAVDILVHPVQQMELVNSMERFKKQFIQANDLADNLILLEKKVKKSLNAKIIAVPFAKGYMFKKVADLHYVQALANYCELHFDKKTKYTLTRTLSEQEILLNDYNFVRIHQSYLVNLSCVDFFNSEELTLHLVNGVVLPVSTRRKSHLLEMIKLVL